MESDLEENLEPKSKSRIKREMLELQDLGEELTRLPQSLMDKCALPEELLHAIEEYKRLPNKRGARKRQLQFIGKRMRNVDVEAIRQVLEEQGQNVALEKRRFHNLELLRDQLVSGDKETLDTLINRCADLDIQLVRQLIRQAEKEAQLGKAPAASRKLFSFLRARPELQES